MKNSNPPGAINCLGGLVMFDILFENRVVGTAQVVRKGLYYRITCKCSFSDERHYRITLLCGEVCRDLGVCIPSGFSTAIPAKSLSEENMRFQAVPDWGTGEFIEVNEAEPFCDLTQLRNARFRIKDGKRGVIIPR